MTQSHNLHKKHLLILSISSSIYLQFLIIVFVQTISTSHSRQKISLSSSIKNIINRNSNNSSSYSSLCSRAE